MPTAGEGARSAIGVAAEGAWTNPPADEVTGSVDPGELEPGAAEPDGRSANSSAPIPSSLRPIRPSSSASTVSGSDVGVVMGRILSGTNLADHAYRYRLDITV